MWLELRTVQEGESPANPPAVLGLADGTVFPGFQLGIAGESVGEVIFNTSHFGYQEILTDPSYRHQIVVFTAPQIGNVGVNEDDAESSGMQPVGLVVRQASPIASNWRHRTTLQDYLESVGATAISGVDTRALTSHLRRTGAQAGCILTASAPGLENTDLASEAVQRARACPALAGMDLAADAGVTQITPWTEAGFAPDAPVRRNTDIADDRNTDLCPHIVVYDFGCKRNILRLLVDMGAHVTLVPPRTSAAEVLQLDPQGILFSNGPGDPEPCSYAIEAAQALMAERLPILGICLGHQILALALGATTFKMKFGHHGANHPVLDLEQRGVFVSSQNHGFAVSQDCPDDIVITHRSLFDGTIQGLRHAELPVRSVQGHPEASPGPQEMNKVLREFVQSVKSRVHA